MYKRIKKLENNSYIQFKSGKGYSLRRIDEQIRFVELNPESYEPEWISEGKVNEFVLIDHFVLLSSINPDYTEIIDLSTKSSIWRIEVSLPLGDFSLKEDKVSVFIKSREKIYEINKQTFEIFNHPLDKNLNLKGASDSKLIFSPRRGFTISVYERSLQKVWQISTEDIASYTDYDGEHKGEINEVFVAEDKVIVLVGFSVLSFDLESGQLQWHAKIDTWQSFGLLQGDYIYTSSNAYINKIDLHTGDILFQRPAQPAKVNGGEIKMSLSRFVWHKDHLWSVMDTSPIVLLKISPEDGSYRGVINLYDLGITRHCQPPQFHEGRMYILDEGNTLHIFEEQ